MNTTNDLVIEARMNAADCLWSPSTSIGPRHWSAGVYRDAAGMFAVADNQYGSQALCEITQAEYDHARAQAMSYDNGQDSYAECQIQLDLAGGPDVYAD